MSFSSDLLEKPANLSTASKYTVMNGYVYLALGALFIVWPGSVQTIFMDAPFVGTRECALSSDGNDGSRHWLALLIRRPFRRSTIRPRFRARSGGARPCSARTPGDSGHFSACVERVCDSRPDTRHRCLGAPQSQDVAALDGRL